VAHCPHLGLEEMEFSPFPFPSVSHHCYATMPGQPADQREQRRYCLTKRYTTCPHFPSPPEEEMLSVTVPEAIPESVEPEAVVRTRATEVIETREVQERLPDRSVEILPPETGPEPLAEQPSFEKAKASVADEILVEPEPVAMAAKVQSLATEKPARDVPSKPTHRITPVRYRGLRWAVAGVAALALLCLGTVVMGVVVGLASGTDISRLQLPTPGSSLLLVVSAASFVGAILLLALFLWARRQAAK
jgi:hypothetical protein